MVTQWQQALPTWVPDVDVDVNEAGQPQSTVGSDTVCVGLEGRGLVAQTIQGLHQEFGALDVGHQGNGMLYGNASGDVALRNERSVPSNAGEG